MFIKYLDHTHCLIHFHPETSAQTHTTSCLSSFLSSFMNFLFIYSNILCPISVVPIYGWGYSLRQRGPCFKATLKWNLHL